MYHIGVRGSQYPFKQELTRFNRFRRGTTTDTSSHNLLVDPESGVTESGDVSAHPGEKETWDRNFG